MQAIANAASTAPRQRMLCLLGLSLSNFILLTLQRLELRGDLELHRVPVAKLPGLGKVQIDALVVVELVQPEHRLAHELLADGDAIELDGLRAILAIDTDG